MRVGARMPVQFPSASVAHTGWPVSSVHFLLAAVAVGASAPRSREIAPARMGTVGRKDLIFIVFG